MASTLYTGHLSMRLQLTERFVHNVQCFHIYIRSVSHHVVFRDSKFAGKEVDVHRVLHFLLREYPGKR